MCDMSLLADRPVRARVRVGHRGPWEDRLWNAFDPMSLRVAEVAAPHDSDPQAVVSANVSTRRRRFPTEFALPFAGIGLGTRTGSVMVTA